MPSPFPGMDPYLETPDLWPDVHHGLIGQIQAKLNPLIKTHYVARVELRVYISDEDDPGRKALIPDLRVETSPGARARKQSVINNGLTIAEPLIIPMLIDNEIEEAYLSIKNRQTGALVTVIEVMSPTNKIRGSEGRKSFMRKKSEIVASEVHWVEIDCCARAIRPFSIRRYGQAIIACSCRAATIATTAATGRSASASNCR